MPLYFFDCTDGTTATVDDDGLTLPDLEAAKDEALRTLRDVARHEMTEGTRRDFTVDVRTGEQGVIWTATIALRSRHLVPKTTGPARGD